MQGYGKRWVTAALTLCMALGVPSLALGAGVREDSAWLSVSTWQPDATASTKGDLLTAGWVGNGRVLAAKDGSVLVSDTVNHVIWKVSGTQRTVFAGMRFAGYNKSSEPLGGLLDGAANTALFNQPMGMDTDAAGNLYVADSGNHAIRKVTPTGQVSTLAGNGVQGFKDGTGPAAALNTPEDVAVAKDGSVYVADTLNHVIRKITADGTVSTLTGSSDRVVEVYSGVAAFAGDYKDGALKDARFNEPSGLALDDEGNLYVSDSGNQVIRYINLKSGMVTTVAGSVTGDGQGAAPGKLYRDGGYQDGAAASAKFNHPVDVAWSSSQHELVIADSLNQVVRTLKDGQVHTLVGSLQGEEGKADGVESTSLLSYPQGVAVSQDGSVGWIAGNGLRQWSLYRQPGHKPMKPAGTVYVAYNAKWLQIDTRVTKDGQTLIPLRSIASELGLKLVSASAKSAVVQSGDRMIQLEAGSTAQSIDGKLYVPIRTLTDLLDKDVKWLASEKTVVIRDK
ncbi:stalk domain-containing protein [Paenibacillus cellulositrophicus]|uniref:stalk domain-containing protein n=1 Tax=Paenibacillus cellulositrophicus TaxID=562959 RepID=UPI00203A8B30|nr:stalk domain-containing protein [Paenibacillus cellulositrophicus]MCM3000187.1 stalk domain-containing protein [Paenibacillus cellulositrophicus]